MKGDVDVNKVVDNMSREDGDKVVPGKLYPHNVEKRMEVNMLSRKVYAGDVVGKSVMDGARLLGVLDKIVERGERTGDVDRWLRELDAVERVLRRL